jgi:hypothetical protein
LLWQIPGWPFSMGAAAPTPIIDAGFGIVYGLVFAFVLGIIFGKTHNAIYDRVAGTSVVVASV